MSQQPTFEEPYRGPPPLPPFSIENAFSVGWAAMKLNYGMLLLMCLLILVFSLAAYAVQRLVQPVLCLGPLLSLSTQFLFSAQISAGSRYVGARAARGESVCLNDLFRAFSNSGFYWSVAGVQGLLVLIAGAIIAPAVVIMVLTSMGSGTPPAYGYTLGILIVVALLCGLLMIRFYFAPLLVIDDAGPQPGPFDALRISWRMTSGKWLSLLCVWLLLGFVGLACIVALVLPLFLLAMPLSLAVVGATYAMLAARGTPAPRPSTTCRRCGYNLAGTGNPFCPACGAPTGL